MANFITYFTIFDDITTMLPFEMQMSDFKISSLTEVPKCKI